MDTATTLLNAAKISISEIFEKMFYMPVEFEERPELESVIRASSFLSAIVGFQGTLTGHFCAMIPVSVLKHIASDFMGADENSITMDDIRGTLGEIVNMISGNSLTMAGCDFHLDLPVISAPDSMPEGPGSNGHNHRIFVKTLCGVFSVSISIQP